MKASFFLGNKSFEIIEAECGEYKGDEVLIKVGACGVCGTDVHIYNGEEGTADVVLPITLGHELAGEVVIVGDNVKTLSPGTHVAIDPNIYCGKCVYCKMGKKYLCDNLHAIGVNKNGGFAEYCIVPEKQCLILNSNIPYEIGAMAEPVACCIHGIENISVKLGDVVCIIGGGSIGLIMLQLAKLSGASVIIVSEPVEMRRNIARELGADYVVNPFEEDLKKALQEYTGRNGADVVIECIGNESTSAQAIDVADKGGKVLLFGVPKPESKVNLNLSDVYKKELTIKGSFINPDTQKAAVELINKNILQLQPLITHRYYLNEIEEAIKKQMSDDSIKVVITML